MNRIIVLSAICALSACQSGELPIVEKLTKPKTSTVADTGPMRPSGTAFDVAGADAVSDFNTCARIGIIVPGSSPIQCVHAGVTYTSN